MDIQVIFVFLMMVGAASWVSYVIRNYWKIVDKMVEMFTKK